VAIAYRNDGDNSDAIAIDDSSIADNAGELPE